MYVDRYVARDVVDFIYSPRRTVSIPAVGKLSATTERIDRMKETFVDCFKASPEHVARAPGRVNLIGEHIDYEGYGVLPMAIQLDTVVAIRVNPDRDVICLHNMDAGKFGVLEFPINPDQELDLENHTWGSYVIAAYKGVFDHLRTHGLEEPKVRGLDILVDGRVPTGSGLSSSAAIVCSSALAIMAALGVPMMKKGEVAEFTAKAEQYVGVISGGMDQAISIMGKPDVAQLIEFNPVRASPVMMPEETAFIVAHSLKVSNKAETSVGHYNLRVVECTIASALLAKNLGASKEDIVLKYKTLSAVEPLIEAFFMEDQGSQEDSNWCVAAVNKFLKEGTFTAKQIEEDLGFKVGELFDEDDAVAKRVIEEINAFKPHARATHVYTEKQRVYDFAQVCADSRYSKSKAAAILGSLMDTSHKSCDEWYECSCPELNSLVKLLRDLGAYGARLTGAGWGGCAVAMVHELKAEGILESLRKKFYEHQEVVENLRKEGEEKAREFIEEMAFVSSPAQGACLIRNW